MNKICEAGYEFRPEELLGKSAYHPLLRYNNGLWTKDDGEWDMAFMSDPDTAEGRSFGYMIYFQLPYHKSDLWCWHTKHRFESKHLSLNTKPNDYGYANGWHIMLQDGYFKEDDLNERVSGLDNESNKYKYPNNIAHASLNQNRHRLGVGHGNGRSVGLDINSNTIKYGLLRCADTKEIVRPPKTFICKDCGEIQFDFDAWDEVKPKIGWDEIAKIQTYHKQLLALSEMIYPNGRITNLDDDKIIKGMENMLIRITDENTKTTTIK